MPPEYAGFLTTPEAKPILASVVTAGEHAFVDAARMAGFVALGFVVLGLIFSFLLPKQKLQVIERVGPEEPVPADGTSRTPAADGVPVEVPSGA